MITMEYDVEASLDRSVAKYEEAVKTATGLYPKLYPVATPYVDDDTRTCEHRAPIPGPFVECPSCLHSFARCDVDKKYKFREGTMRPIMKISHCTFNSGRSIYH